MEFLNKFCDFDLSTDKGLSYEEIIQGIKDNNIKSLFIMSDGFSDELLDEDILNSISQLQFLVVGATKKNALTELADVVIPISHFPEQEGTMTNLERRVQLSPKSHKTKKDSKSIWEFYSSLAQPIGSKDFKYESPSDIFNEIKSVEKEYQDIDYNSLKDSSKKWNLINKKINLLPANYIVNDDENNGLLFLHGRVLTQPDISMEVTDSDNKNIIKSFEEWRNSILVWKWW